LFFFFPTHNLKVLFILVPVGLLSLPHSTLIDPPHQGGRMTEKPFPHRWLVGDATDLEQSAAGVSYSALTVAQQILAQS
jgi:hypothetical protein